MRKRVPTPQSVLIVPITFHHRKKHDQLEMSLNSSWWTGNTTLLGLADCWLVVVFVELEQNTIA